MRLPTTPCALLLAAVAFAGCGGPTSDHDKIVVAVIAYVEAVTSADGDAVCEVLTGKPLAEARENGVCGLDGGAPRRLSTKVEVADIVITGDRADAEMRQGRSVALVSLLRRDGEWLIDGLDLKRSEFRVASESMQPTLQQGERVLVDATAYRAQPVRRGDVIVFSAPETRDDCADPDAGDGRPRMCDKADDAFPKSPRLIMRVVGVAGDRLAMPDGRLTVGGRPESGVSVAACEDDAVCSFPEAITVPDDTVFVLGDNRPESADSRFFGPIPASAVLGKVVEDG